MNYSELSTDDLVDLFRETVEADTPGDGQHAAVERINAIKHEIDKRDGAIERYISLLSDPSTHVRYSAALSVQWVDPDRAYRVFKSLVDEPRSRVQMKSQMAMYQLEESGRLSI